MKALAAFLVLFFVAIIMGFSAPQTTAEPGLGWTEGLPILAKTSMLSARPLSDCPTYEQDLFITELGASRNVCVYGDERLRIGTFLESGNTKVAVAFPYTTAMHVLDGACVSICRYSADTDTLVTQQTVSQYGRGLVVFQHVSSRIHRITVSDSTVRYEFDASNPEYAMKSDTGRYTWNPSIALSGNGKWAVTELYDHGIAVLNLETFVARHITTSGYLYGRGMDPTEELAISNDGKSVAVTGQNAGFHVFEVRDECGQRLLGDLSALETTVQCPSSDIGIGLTFPNFASAHRPHFFGNGHQLELVVLSWVGAIQRVTYVTAGTPIAHQLKILSLGDSFSSGEGETDDMYYAPGTNTGFDRCHVGLRAYPTLVARSMGISDADAKNLACSGAQLKDMVGSDDDYWGQGNRLGSGGLELSLSQKTAASEKAIDDFQPGRSLQANFIDRYNPEILTIGIGGNDAGLMGKLRTCAMPDTCEWAEGVGIKQTAGEIKRLEETLGSFFASIKNKVESSRVFIVGYPDIIEPDGVCDPVTTVLINHTERIFIQNSIQYLNQVIRAATNKVGFTYVDSEHSFEGTKLCSGNASTAMNGLRFGDDIAVITGLPMLKIIGAETFHPTPIGHGLIAETMLASYPGMVNTLPVTGEPSTWWSEASGGAVPSAFATDFAYKDGNQPQQMKVLVPAGTLQPDSIVTIEIHSTPMQLATFVVDDNGGLNGVVSIPADLGQGFHTLHLLGTNRAGAMVDMYQFLTIGEAGTIVGTSSTGDSFSASIGGVDDSLSGAQPPQSNALKGIAEVLGAQSTDGMVSHIGKTVAPIVSYIREIVWLVRWIVFGVGAFVTICLSTLCVLLVSKRWAKHGS